jgi:hypothetical protein
MDYNDMCLRFDSYFLNKTLYCLILLLFFAFFSISSKIISKKAMKKRFVKNEKRISQIYSFKSS